MIVQQVNLYRDSFKPKQRHNYFPVYVGASVLFACLFAGFHLVLLKERRSQQASIAQAMSSLNAKTAEVKLLESKMPKQRLDAALLAETEQWQKKVTELKQIIAMLDKSNPTQAPGFSAYFQALANQPPSGIWLSVIHFDAQQQLINFEGSTFKTDRIPHFLQQLQKEPVFHGCSFANLTVEKAEKIPHLMNFKLSTHLEPLKKNHVE